VFWGKVVRGKVIWGNVVQGKVVWGNVVQGKVVWENDVWVTGIVPFDYPSSSVLFLREEAS
jgi:hypothetical protein